MHPTGPDAGAVPVPRNPKVADASGCSGPFHDALRAVTDVPDVVRSADHDWATAPPDGSVKAVDHRVIGAVPAVTCTDAW